MKVDQLFFCCIGAQKAGTTWLGKVLSKHPNIWVHPLKELHYFDYLYSDKLSHAEIFYRRKRSLLNYLKSVQYEQFRPSLTELQLMHTYSKKYDDDWYIKLFHSLPKHALAYGELTPSYSRIPIEGFMHMKRMYPNLKLIYLMRAPKDRLESSLKMFIRNRSIDLSADVDDVLIKFLNNPDNYALGNYPLTLDNMNSVFRESDVLTFFYEDIFTGPDGPEEFLKKLCGHLNVEFKMEFFAEIIGRKFNSTQSYVLSDKVRRHIEELTDGVADAVLQRIGYIPLKWYK